MAYHVKYRRLRPLTHMDECQTFTAQGENLARKFVVDDAIALTTRASANYFCTRPNPDYVLCSVFNDLANKQEEKAGNSLLTFSAWSLVALLAAIAEELVERLRQGGIV